MLLQVTCPERDRKEFTRLGYRLRERLGNGCVGLIDDRAPNGHSQQLQEIASQGVISHGHSGAGTNYPPVVLASDGTDYAVCDTVICDGLPAIEVAEDGTLRGKEAAEQYWRVLKSARAELAHPKE